MPGVVFVAPFLLPATARFAAAVAALPGVRLGLLTQDPASRLPPALAAHATAHRQVADAFDPRQLAAAAEALAPHLGGVDRLFGALEQLQLPLAEARQRLGVEGLSPEAARNFRDKDRMKTVLREAGLPCARHRLVADGGAARRFAEEVGFPLVAKPPAGAGAKGTFRLDGKAALEEALALLAPHPGAELLLEEMISGQEHSFETVSVDGRPLWTSSSRYLPTPLEALSNPWIQWCVLLPREREESAAADLRRAAFAALAALGMETGLSHMEWFRSADGSIALSEVAARPPGAQIMSLLSVAHEHDFHAAWARLMVHGEWQVPERRWAAGAAFLRGVGGRRVKAVRGLGEAQRELGELVVEARLPQPGQPKSSSYEGEGHVLLRHRDTAVVERALHRLVSLVRVEME
jgi:biotin carboxylase